MDFQKMKYFIEVVENGSISKAAQSLHMTQPPLSMAMRKLEKELGVELFERQGRVLRLTGTGQIFYERSKELIIASEEIAEEIKKYHYGKKGKIRIGCSSIVNFLLIPRVMEKIYTEKLDFVIEVTEGNASFILDSLRKNELDIGIVRSVFKEKDIMIKQLYTEPLMLALPPQHDLLKKETSICMGDLKDEKFLMQSTTYGYNVSELIIQECDEFGFYPDIVYWGTETLPMLNMVNKGLGVAIMPKSFSKLEYFNLPRFIELKHTSLLSTLSLVTFNQKIKKQSTDKFIDLLDRVVVDMKGYHSYLG